MTVHVYEGFCAVLRAVLRHPPRPTMTTGQNKLAIHVS